MHERRTRNIGSRLPWPAILVCLASVTSADEGGTRSAAAGQVAEAAERAAPADRPEHTEQHAGHTGHAEHGAKAGAAATPLREAGQGAFAAIAEAVSALSADPGTDWSDVDIDALRDHLVSMNRLVLDAEVERVVLDDGYRFVVGGQGRTRRALHEMVPAHAAVLVAETPWTVVAERTGTGVTLTVTSDDAAERQRIGALGFFGLMATGDHHREHHLAVATGRPMH